jgi:hypothetical protein
VSWDVVLLRFCDGGAATFDVEEAKRIVLAADGVRLTEPGVAEITSDGIADIHFGGQSPEIMFFVYGGSATVTQLIHHLARELQMVVFFPTTDGWGAAVTDQAAAEALPDRSWSGWQDFDDDFDPPVPAVCRTAQDLDGVFGGSYGAWEEWAHPPRE